MLKIFPRIRHSEFGMWLTIMKANPTVTNTTSTSQVVHLPTRGGWPSNVDYPPQRSK